MVLFNQSWWRTVFFERCLQKASFSVAYRSFLANQSTESNRRQMREPRTMFWCRGGHHQILASPVGWVLASYAFVTQKVGFRFCSFKYESTQCAEWVSRCGSTCRRGSFHRLVYLRRVPVHRRWAAMTLSLLLHLYRNLNCGYYRRAISI